MARSGKRHRRKTSAQTYAKASASIAAELAAEAEAEAGRAAAAARAEKAAQAAKAAADPAVATAHAANLKNLSGASYLYASAAPFFGPELGFGAYQAYLDQLLRDSGDPADPVARMLIEQLALCHHAHGRVQAQAAQAAGESAALLLGAAARLLGEYRKTALALKEYRGPAAQVPGKVPGGGEATPVAADTKLGSKAGRRTNSQKVGRRTNSRKVGRRGRPRVARAT